MQNISNRRECFFDDHLIDTTRTTAEFRVHQPIRREVVLEHTAPWEGNGSDYHNTFFDDGIWRMYYLGWEVFSEPFTICVCYAESTDGIHWVKPNLGIYEWEGSLDNNIIFGPKTLPTLDNFMVFRDDNPACPPEKRYKAILSQENRTLWYFYSADALHFSKGGILTDQGSFDSLNVAFWDSLAKKYRCYFRAGHAPGSREALRYLNESHVRDIRYMESEDFEHWTDPVLLDFGDAEDIALYTNVVQPYYRAPHMLIGFPSRYNYRRQWTKTFDELCGQEARRKRCDVEERLGLVTTDCVFMCSRDGIRFTRHDEAFLRPGIENGKNWVYGDGYPTRGIIETPSEIEGAPNELSMYIFDNHWNGPTRLWRYTLRLDGFVSLHAGATEKVIVTKPFLYDGDALFINFSTSAWGSMYFTLIGEDGTRYESLETFGDAIDRRVHFENEDAVAALRSTPVTLEIRMRDADLYSLKFE